MWNSEVGDGTVTFDMLCRNVKAHTTQIVDPSVIEIDAQIRSYLETAVKMMLEAVLVKYNAQRKSAYAELVRREIALGSADLIRSFEAAVRDYTGRAVSGAPKGGLVLLEPHAAVPANPPIVIGGTVFPAQGDSASKRIKLVVQDESDGTIRFVHTSGDDRWSDYRMLGGDVMLSSTELGQIMHKLVNAAPLIQLTVEGLPLPVLIRREDVEAIAAKLHLDNVADLPMWSDWVVDEIKKKVDERISSVTAKRYLDVLVGSVELVIEGVKAEHVDAIRALVTSLRSDPVLFVLSILPDEKTSERNMYSVPQRTRSLARGIDPKALKTIFSNPSAELYSVAYKDQSIAIDTMYNALQPGHCVRLSEWQAALESRETLQSVPVPDTEPNRTTVPGAGDARVVLPSREKQFRMSLMNPMANPSEEVDAAAVDFDSPFKPFELDIHMGDRQSHFDEAAEVVRTALNMLFAPAPSYTSTVTIGDGPNLDRILPHVPGKECKVKKYERDDRIAWNGGNVSACSRFLYTHAALKTSAAPVGPPSYHDLSNMLATAEPFPVPSETEKRIGDLGKLVRERLRAKFAKCTYLVQNTNVRASVHAQPITPYCVDFTPRSILSWAVGTASTPALEAVLLAVSIVRWVLQTEIESRGHAAFVPANDAFRAAPAPVDIKAPLSESCKLKDSTPRYTLQNVQTGDMYDVKEFAEELKLNRPHTFIKCGPAVVCAVTGIDLGQNAGPVGLFKWDPPTNDGMVFPENAYIYMDEGHNEIAAYVMKNDFLCVNTRLLAQDKDTYVLVPEQVFVYDPENGENGLLFRNVTRLTAKSVPPVGTITETPDDPPFDFSECKGVNKSFGDIADAIVDGAQGLHFNNTKSLSRTVFAGVVGNLRGKLHDYLTENDPRYTGRVPWAVNVQDDEGIPGKRALNAHLSALYHTHQQSVLRTQDAAMVERVLTMTKGPHKSDLATETFVEGWLYRTATYIETESTLIGRLVAIVRDVVGMPEGAVRNPLAVEIRRSPNITIAEILRRYPRVESQLTNVMMEVFEFSKIPKQTQKARNTNALVLAHSQLNKRLTALAFYT